MTGTTNFVEDVRKAIDGLETIEEVKGLFDKDTLSKLRLLADTDFSNIDELIASINTLQKSSDDIKAVVNGLPDIENVLELQNQIAYISDIRDQIGLVAGNTNSIRSVASRAELYDYLKDNFKMYAQIINMEELIESAIKNSKEIDTVAKIANQIRTDVDNLEKMVEQTKKDVKRAAIMMNDAGQAERRIDDKLRQMEAIEERMQQFSIEVVHTGPEIKASSKYNPTKNELFLSIPSGEQGRPGDTGEKGAKGSRGVPGTAVEKGSKGDRGDPGIDGKNFAVSAMGNKRDMKKYGNMPIGFSFLSLDENPTMIYFRKSNTKDDWTDGQPFGLTDGEEARITVSDSERVGGYTVDQLLLAIQKNVERIIYGSSSKPRGS